MKGMNTSSTRPHRTLLMIATLAVLGFIAAAATLRAQPGLLVAHDTAGGTDSLVRSYKMVLKDGGPDGFNVINETMTDEPTPRHVLICIDPGYDKGGFSTIPNIDRERPHLVDHAKEQIASGIPSGHRETVSEGMRYIVDWHGTDVNNCTIEEWQYKVIRQ